MGRQEPGKVRAGVYAALVHLAFLAVLVFGVSWQSYQASPVAVELWESLPSTRPTPRPPRPEPQPEPKPAPKPVAKPEPKPEPKLEPKAKSEPRPTKADIELKAKEKEKEARRREEEQKKAAEQKKAEEKKAAEQKKAAEEKRKQDEAKRKEQERQQLALQQQQAEQALRAQQEAVARQQAAAQGRLVNDYMARINGKIKRLINNQACLPLGNPEVRFDVTLMPTGELLMDPRLAKSSGNGACDQAIERAILRAQPLPLPPDPALFSQFRDLHLKFRPNENE
jgi:colicin import membrane protein